MRSHSSPAAYDVLATALELPLRSQGMERLSRAGCPTWRRRFHDSAFAIYFSIQIDSKATDPYSGAGFRIELERTIQPVPASGLNGRALFFQLLNKRELAELLVHQNEIIRSLPKPPSEHVGLYPGGPVRDQYLKYFESQIEFDAINCWLRYRTGADVSSWPSLLAPLVTPLLERGSILLDPQVRHLGKGSLLVSTG